MAEICHSQEKYREINNTMDEKSFYIHISSSQGLTLKNLTDALNILNLSINDYYRDNGVVNSVISDFSPSIKGVQEGSVILEIAISIFTTVTSALLVEYIKSRFEKKKEKSDDRITIINVYVVGDENGVINIDLDNLRQ